MMSYGLIAGMPLETVRRSSPGLVMDMYLYRRDYDMSMHGMKKKKGR